MAEIICGVVQPDYSQCCDTVIPPSVPAAIVVGPPGPPGPTGPPGPSGTGSSCPVYCNPGEPEGVQTSIIGGLYLQTDRAATSHPYFAKRTGTGNTGWRGWAGLQGSAVGSFEIGDNASVTALRGIGIGTGANVADVEGLVIGDGVTKNPNDIVLGWGHVLGRRAAAATIVPNVAIGYQAFIGSVDDISASTMSGGHVLIGYQTSTPYDKTNWANTVIGKLAKANGHAVIAVGHLAEGRVANNPVTGRDEARFATIMGYAAKASGGCVVSIGDQSDVRGDNSVALGTHSRANDHSTAAIGPSCFAGSVSADNTGQNAVAVGYSVQALRSGAVGVGIAVTANAYNCISIGNQAFINTPYYGAIAIGHGATPTRPNQMMFGDDLVSNGRQPVLAVHFNGSAQPAFFVSVSGQVQFVNPLADNTRAFPIVTNVTATATDTNFFFDTTSGVKTLQLPLVSGVPVGTKYFVRLETSGANPVTILPSGTEKVDGGASYVLGSQYKYIVLRSTLTVGNEWRNDASN